MALGRGDVSCQRGTPVEACQGFYFFVDVPTVTSGIKRVKLRLDVTKIPLKMVGTRFVFLPPDTHALLGLSGFVMRIARDQPPPGKTRGLVKNLQGGR